MQTAPSSSSSSLYPSSSSALFPSHSFSALPISNNDNDNNSINSIPQNTSPENSSQKKKRVKKKHTGENALKKFFPDNFVKLHKTQGVIFDGTLVDRIKIKRSVLEWDHVPEEVVEPLAPYKSHICSIGCCAVDAVLNRVDPSRIFVVARSNATVRGQWVIVGYLNPPAGIVTDPNQIGQIVRSAALKEGNDATRSQAHQSPPLPSNVMQVNSNSQFVQQPDTLETLRHQQQQQFLMVPNYKMTVSGVESMNSSSGNDSALSGMGRNKRVRQNANSSNANGSQTKQQSYNIQRSQFLPLPPSNHESMPFSRSLSSNSSSSVSTPMNQPFSIQQQQQRQISMTSPMPLGFQDALHTSQDAFPAAQKKGDIANQSSSLGDGPRYEFLPHNEQQQQQPMMNTPHQKRLPQTPGAVQYSLPAICSGDQAFVQRQNYAAPRQNDFTIVGSSQNPNPNQGQSQGTYNDQNFLGPEFDAFEEIGDVDFDYSQEQSGISFSADDMGMSANGVEDSSGGGGGTYGYMLTNTIVGEGMSLPGSSNSLLGVQPNRLSEVSLENGTVNNVSNNDSINNPGMMWQSEQESQFAMAQGKDGKSYALEIWKNYFGEVLCCTWSDFKRFVTEKNPVERDVLDRLKELFCRKGPNDVVDYMQWVKFVLLFHTEYFDNDPRPILSFNEALDLFNKGFHGFIERVEADRILRDQDDLTCGLFRVSGSSCGFLVFSRKGTGNVTKHTLIGHHRKGEMIILKQTGMNQEDLFLGDKSEVNRDFFYEAARPDMHYSTLQEYVLVKERDEGCKYKIIAKTSGYEDVMNPFLM